MPRTPKSVTPAAGLTPADPVEPDFTRTEALALIRIADTGLRVAEALSLIQNLGSAEAALLKLKRADMSRGQLRGQLMGATGKPGASALGADR